MDDYMDVGMVSYSVTYSAGGNRGESDWSGYVSIPTYRLGSIIGPIVSIQHPTIFDRKYSPSNYPSNDYTNSGYIGRSPKSVIEAAKMINILRWLHAQNIVVMADYPGLGNDTETVHTFCHEESLALSVVNMIQKAIKFMDKDHSGYYTDDSFLWN